MNLSQVCTLIYSIQTYDLRCYHMSGGLICKAMLNYKINQQVLDALELKKPIQIHNYNIWIDILYKNGEYYAKVKSCLYTNSIETAILNLSNLNAYVPYPYNGLEFNSFREDVTIEKILKYCDITPNSIYVEHPTHDNNFKSYTNASKEKFLYLYNANIPMLIYLHLFHATLSVALRYDNDLNIYFEETTVFKNAFSEYEKKQIKLFGVLNLC